MVNLAWLQKEDGTGIVLDRQLTIGRAEDCDLMLSDPLVSRHHARLQLDEQQQRWTIIDLNSTNGVYVNEQRIRTLAALHHGDQILIGDTRFHFHQPRSIDETDPASTLTTTDTLEESTQLAIHSHPCWLILVDVAGSTRLVQELRPEEYHRVMWSIIHDCETLVTRHGGQVNEYLGDGMLAFLRHHGPRERQRMHAMLEEFARCAARRPGYRVLIHYGPIAFGGGISSGLEKLSGPELNFIFKSEKVAGATGEPLVVTENARQTLSLDDRQLQFLGKLDVPGFPGKHAFYAYRGGNHPPCST